MTVAFDVAEGRDVLLVYNRHELCHFVLDLRVKFQFVDADAVFRVGGNRATRVEALRKKAFHLFDAALVRAVALHNFKEDGNVKRDQRNHGGGTRHKSLVHGDVGLAVKRFLELFVEFESGALDVLLGGADGAVAINGMRIGRADVGVGDGFYTLGKDARCGEPVYPARPVFTAHHLDGLALFLFVCDFGRDDGELARYDVHRRTGERLFERLQDAAILFARYRIDADGARDAVDDEVELAELFGRLDDLLSHFVGECVAVERDASESLRLGGPVKRHVVVPARRAALCFGAFAFEGNTHRVRSAFKGRGNAACEAVARRASQD